jgi:Leucine-rich repeat (LRR) protein
MIPLKKFFFLIFFVCLASSVKVNFKFHGYRHLWGQKFIDCVFDNVDVLSDNEVIDAKTNTEFNSTEFSNMTLYIESGPKARLVYCPVGISKIFHQNISILSFENSTMKFVSRKCLTEMKYLRYLLLNDNDIENIPEDTFWDLPNLLGLDIINNKIKVLPGKLLSRSMNLMSLMASGNKIEILTEDHLRYNTKLAFLRMDNGGLTKIKVDFQAFSHLLMVDFTGNPCTNQSFQNNVTNLQVFQQSLNETCSGNH